MFYFDSVSHKKKKRKKWLWFDVGCMQPCGKSHYLGSIKPGLWGIRVASVAEGEILRRLSEVHSQRHHQGLSQTVAMHLRQLLYTQA